MSYFWFSFYTQNLKGQYLQLVLLSLQWFAISSQIWVLGQTVWAGYIPTACKVQVLSVDQSSTSANFSLLADWHFPSWWKIQEESTDRIYPK